MCAGALYWSQITKIVYGAKDLDRGYEAMGTKLHPKTKVVQGVMAQECSDLLKRFFDVVEPTTDEYETEKEEGTDEEVGEEFSDEEDLGAEEELGDEEF